MPIDSVTLVRACRDHAAREADTLDGLRGSLMEVRAALIKHDMAALRDALTLQAENQRAVDELRQSREALQRQAAVGLDLEPAGVTLRVLAARVGGATGERLCRERERLWRLGAEVERLNAANALLARHGLDFVRNLLVVLTGGMPGGDGYGPDGAPARRAVVPCFGSRGETMTMIGYTTGLSALTGSQQAIDIAGQNIANANTPGYHRQTVDLRASQPTLEDNLSIGTGVTVTDISRARSTLIESAVNANASASAATTAQLGVLQQLQTVIAPGSGSVSGLLGQFFDQLDQLSAKPDDATARQTTLTSAASLTAGLQSLSASFIQVGQGVDAQLAQTVGQINSLTSQIAKLNGEIASIEAGGASPNDQLDKRDHLISQLGALVNIQTVDAGSGATNVLAAGQTLVQGTQTVTLTYAVDSSGNGAISSAGLPALAPAGGAVAGLLQVRNQILPDYQGRVNALAHQLIQSANAIQSTGLGLSGPFNFLAGAQAATSTTQPLAKAGLDFPPQAGSLYVTVTNVATDAKTVNRVDIDPNTQSLQDVAAALSAVPHLQGVVDGQSNTLKILAQPGYAFSFAPQLSTVPDAQAITGTTRIQIGGAYTGKTNGLLNFKVVGSGTVGVTPNLTLAVTDATGNTVASLNIGQGYEPSSALTVVNGVSIKLASGTVNNGDTFSVTTVAQPDSAGILPALGLNSFFSGANAADIAVRPDLTADPRQFAGSLTGQPGDGANVSNLAALRNAPLLANGSQTLQQSFANLVGNVAGGVQDATQQQSAQKLIGQSLQTQQQSVSGVDPNEELVQLVQSQQAYQLAAHYISVLDTTVASLLAIT